MILATILGLASICINDHETLLRERNTRPAVVFVVGAGIVQQVEGYTYLQTIRRLPTDMARWERASVAIQIAILRQPFKRPGELVDYVAGAAAFVDTPVLRLQAVPRITLVETVTRYLTAKSSDDRRMYGELLYAVSENRANSCSFWR